MWFVQFQPQGAQSISEIPFCPIWAIKALHEWFSSCQKKMPIPQLQPSTYKELCKDNQTKTGQQDSICPLMQTLVQMLLSTYFAIKEHKWLKRSIKSQKATKITASQTSSSSHHNPTKSRPPWKDNKGKQNFKSKGNCTQCGDFKHKDNCRCPESRHKCKICSKVGLFPKMQCIQLAQAHDDQTATLQLSDKSFHDANEEYMPSDDDFVHNYMVRVYKTSLQQKSGKSSKFQQIKHFVKVKLKPYHTHAVYMHAYVDTGADVNLMPWDMYINSFPHSQYVYNSDLVGCPTLP